MLRFGASGIALLIGAAATAQAPTVTFGLDLNPRVGLDSSGNQIFRWNDDVGNFSRVRFSANFENGLHVRVFQKLERIHNDPDTSTLDEAYVERPGDWRIGKQVLPFGSGRIFKDSALAAKLDLDLIVADLPISLAYANSEDRQKGFTARFGDNVGVSIAVGDRFGINAASFTQIRPPDETDRRRRGYGLMYGADVTKKTEGWTLAAEWIRLRNGETTFDEDEDVVDGLLSYQFPYGPLVQAEATALVSSNRFNYAIAAEVPIASNAFLAPSVRYFDKRGWTASVVLRVRL